MFRGVHLFRIKFRNLGHVSNVLFFKNKFILNNFLSFYFLCTEIALKLVKNIGFI